jgi:hypothetical protein
MNLLRMAPLAAALLLGACADLSAVRGYADETRKLSLAFAPMLEGAVASCADNYVRKKMLASPGFDPLAAEQAAAELCGPIARDNQAIAALNALLEQYADTLAALADDRLPSYQEDIGALSASAAALTDRATGEPLIPAPRLEAVTALGQALARLAGSRQQRAAVNELLAHEDAVNAIADALRAYADHNYRAWLRDERRDNEVLQRMLAQSASSEPLAANYLKTVLLRDERQAIAREQAIDAFVAAVTQLRQANAELRRRQGRAGSKEQLAQLAALARDVAGLRRQVMAAY